MRTPRGDRVVTIQHVIRAAHLPVSQEGAGPDRRESRVRMRVIVS